MLNFIFIKAMIYDQGRRLVDFVYLFKVVIKEVEKNKNAF